MKSRIVAPLVVIVVLASTLPAAAATHRRPVPDRREVAAAQLVGPDANASAAATIARFVLDKAAGALAARGAGFIMGALGLNSLFPPQDNLDLAQLREIKDQLDDISGQIADMQRTLNSISRDVRQGELNNQLIALRAKTTIIADVYTTAFKPLLNQAIDLAKAQADGSPTEIADAKAELIAQRNTFYATFDACSCGAIQGYVHEFLVPGAATSVLAALGKLILADKRYVTQTESNQIRSLYDVLAESESLAAWMRMERWIPSDPRPPAPIGRGDIGTYNDVRTQYLTDTTAEFVNLPPAIPADTVVDAGAGARDTTNNATMWLPAATQLQFFPGVGGDGSVTAALGAMNSAVQSGFNDWQVPAQSTVAALVSGFSASPATTTLNAFLSGLNPTRPLWTGITTGAWPYVWSNDVNLHKMTCKITKPFADSTTLAFNEHTGVSSATATPVWADRPIDATLFDATGQTINVVTYCALIHDAIFNNNPLAGKGGFVASRSTGNMPMDYMAQGPGPHLRPNANLRGSDLSAFNLTGVDLSGADLSGATLTGAVLSGARLAGAKLAGVTSGAIVGTPASLPTGWRLVNGYLAGPGANLTGADLHDGNLSGVNLTGTRLTGVRSGGVDCTGCTLPTEWLWTGAPSGYLVGPSANLVDADLTGANLTGVRSGGIDCTDCTLPAGWRWTGLRSGYLAGPGANLTGADLSGTDLSHVDLAGSTLRGASLLRADLSDANLAGADLTAATVARANLTRVDLRTTNLNRIGSGVTDCTDCVLPPAWLWTGLPTGHLVGPGADLRNANLQGIDLFGATLTNTVIAGADLRLANLQGVISGGVVATAAGFSAPRLPADWRVVNGYLMGPGANLTGANLSATNMSTYMLADANLTNANLTDAGLVNATLTNAVLTGANISGTAFSSDNDNKLAGITSGGLVGVPRNLPPSGRYRVVEGYFIGPGTNLTGATFTKNAQLGVALSATNFTNAKLNGVNLSYAYLNNANFSGATLTGTTLTGANLVNATLTGVTSGGIVGNAAPLPPGWRLVNGFLLGPGANATGANLAGTNLTGLNLAGANLANASLSNANLTGVDLTRANLRGTILGGATWSNTTCPDGVTQSTPCAPLAGSWGLTSSVDLTANTAGNYLRIDVEPNVRDTDWRFDVERRTPSGQWLTIGSYVTEGAGEKRIVDEPPGTFRVVVPTQNDYLGSVSDPVALNR